MFVCKSISLANFLMGNGLRCERVDEDRSNPNYVVFLFGKSDEWDILMKKWTKLRKN